MGERSLDHLLERCLQEMERTGDSDAVLRRYSEEGERLRPLLQLALRLREEYAQVPEPQARLTAGWGRLRQEARRLRRAAAAEHIATRRRERSSNMRLRLLPTLVSLVVAVLMAGVAGVALALGLCG